MNNLPLIIVESVFSLLLFLPLFLCLVKLRWRGRVFIILWIVLCFMLPGLFFDQKGAERSENFELAGIFTVVGIFLLDVFCYLYLYLIGINVFGMDSYNWINFNSGWFRQWLKWKGYDKKNDDK